MLIPICLFIPRYVNIWQEFFNSFLMSAKKNTKKLYGKTFLSLFFIVFSFFSLISCSRKSSFIQFDNETPDAIKIGVQWVLLVSPYVSCHEEPDYSADVTEHLRRGEIRMCKGVRSVRTEDLIEKWYLLEEGWVSESSVSVFQNKLKADEARKKMMQK